MQIRTHQECRMGLGESNKQWHKPNCHSRDRLQVVHIVEKQMFTGWAFVLRMAQIGQKKIFVNTMWSSIFLTSLNLFKHHQQSVCAIIIITTPTTLPRGFQYVKATREQFDLVWETLATKVRSFRIYVAPFHVVGQFYFINIHFRVSLSVLMTVRGR